jgi:transcriptional repressor of dcmA and dcmR
VKRTLLTLEEAAAHLGVSKVSLRRWTNQGVLPCVRLGARRERRFRVEDLDRLLEQPAAVEARPRAGPAGHVALYYRTLDEHWELFRPYLLEHLERGLPVVYIHDDARAGNLRRRLRQEGLDRARLGRAGLLRVLPASQAYLRTGAFGAARMIDFMESTILDLRARGHAAGLVTGETNWTMGGAEGVAEFIDYEERLNQLLARYPEVTVVCHYDLRSLSGEVVFRSLPCHPTHRSRLADVR